MLGTWKDGWFPCFVGILLSSKSWRELGAPKENSENYIVFQTLFLRWVCATFFFNESQVDALKYISSKEVIPRKAVFQLPVRAALFFALSGWIPWKSPGREDVSSSLLIRWIAGSPDLFWSLKGSEIVGFQTSIVFPLPPECVFCVPYRSWRII